MKKVIHPESNKMTINCVCGAKHETSSTKNIDKVDICSECTEEEAKTTFNSYS